MYEKKTRFHVSSHQFQDRFAPAPCVFSKKAIAKRPEDDILLRCLDKVFQMAFCFSENTGNTV